MYTRPKCPKCGVEVPMDYPYQRNRGRGTGDYPCLNERGCSVVWFEVKMGPELSPRPARPA